MRPDAESTTSDGDAWATRVSAGVAQGNRDALAELYEARYDRLYWLVRERTGRGDAFACDCVHDAWMRVLRALPALASVAALDKWLARAALSAAVDRIRRDGARARRESERSLDAASTLDSTTLERLRDEIDRLADDDRSAISLRYLRELSLDALASALGIGKKTAESRVRRALARLRERLNEPADG